jgi:hypothetical protein
MKDMFEDADEMTTPRPPGRSSSPEATRSLTDRRPSTVSNRSKDKDVDGPVQAVGKGSHTELKSGHKKTDSHAEQRISVTSLDEVILDEG